MNEPGIADPERRLAARNRRMSSWVTLGVAGQQCTTTFSQVADQGSDWVLRFQAQGVDAGSVTISRADLEAAHWTVTMPAEVGKSLVDRHVPLPPHRDCGAAPVP